ncbi:hypothetical protein DQQ10_07780 [Pseudochryseolinea flava]|uniref:Response regulatory domain-containing protein n=2 Tax=Pseudochryseolinea flava TaxID=2059302 RepID=A0A364Y3M2_9BACT|nr:hypothetical protein DQQ10_07780 [Pseudochryseolinea flava]
MVDMSSKCCLFIDNDIRNRNVFSDAMEYISPTTFCFMASTASEALFMLLEERLVPSYIFVELNIPGMSGKEFLKEIKQHETLKDIAVIIHCTSPRPNEILELKELGAHAIYFRPYQFNGICNMLTLYFTDQMAGILPN